MKIKTWDSINILRGYVEGLILGVRLSDDLIPETMEKALQRVQDTLVSVMNSDPVEITRETKPELKEKKGKAKK